MYYTSRYEFDINRIIFNQNPQKNALDWNGVDIYVL